MDLSLGIERQSPQSILIDSIIKGLLVSNFCYIENFYKNINCCHEATGVLSQE